MKSFFATVKYFESTYKVMQKVTRFVQKSFFSTVTYFAITYTHSVSFANHPMSHMKKKQEKTREMIEQKAHLSPWAPSSQPAETAGSRQEEVIARYRRSPSPKAEVMSSR